jgi:signal transduction histidine kinase
VNDLQRRQLGVIYSAAFALTSVADDLVDMSRRGESIGREAQTVFSLAEVAESVAHMLRPMAEAKGIDFRTTTPREDRRYGRPVALSRVLVNLATNALKFTEEGFVEIAAANEGFDAIRFTITDSGRGIPRDAQATLFETFRKSRQRKGFFFSGSGLGLNIARRLVEEMGGQLDYDTRLDHGTRFFFTIKLPPPHV